jgi:hypothetical protein
MQHEFTLSFYCQMNLNALRTVCSSTLIASRDTHLISVLCVMFVNIVVMGDTHIVKHLETPEVLEDT